MITMAQARGVDVIIATVMPVHADVAAVPTGTTLPKIRALNAQIFALAAAVQPGASVSISLRCSTRIPQLIGMDGLHPTIEGQTRIAEAFRDEIVRRYDGGSTTSLRSSTLRRTR